MSDSDELQIEDDSGNERNRRDKKKKRPKFDDEAREPPEQAMQAARAFNTKMNRERLQRALLPQIGNESQDLWYFNPLNVWFEKNHLGPQAVEGKGDKPSAGVHPFDDAFNVHKSKKILSDVVAVFSGIVFARLSVVRMEYLVRLHGGSVQLTCSEGKQATHVIFAGDFGKTVQDANDNGIPVVSEDWLLDSMAHGHLMELDKYVVSTQPLEDLVFYIVGERFALESEAIWERIIAYGGEVSNSMHPGVTHVVVSDNTTYERFRTAYKNGIAVVTEHFIHASINRGRKALDGIYSIPEYIFIQSSAGENPTVYQAAQVGLVGTRTMQGAQLHPMVAALQYVVSLVEVDGRSQNAARRPPQGRNPFVGGMFKSPMIEKVDSSVMLACGKAVKSEDGFYCLLDKCGLSIKGPRVNLARHMRAHERRDEWHPPSAEESAAAAPESKKKGRSRKRKAPSEEEEDEESVVRDEPMDDADDEDREGKCDVMSCTAKGGDVIECTECLRKFHSECVNLPEHIIPALKQRDDWRCTECKVCEVCEKDDPETEELMMFCDACDRGFHTFCLQPPLKQPPEGEWLCEECKN